MRPQDQALLRLARIHGWQDQPAYHRADLSTLVEPLLRSPAADIATVGPLVLHSLKSRGLLGVLPAAQARQLEEHRRSAVARDLVAQQVLTELAGEFSRIGVEPLLLKGAAFNRWIYSPEAPRVTTDLDFLVRREEVFAVDGMLRQLGVSGEPIDAQKLASPRALETTYVWHRPAEPVYLDVHWSLTPDAVFTWDLDGCRSRARSLGLFGTLGPEDALLFLAAHALCSFVGPPHALLDAHELVHQCEIDADRLWRLAGAAHAKWALLFFLTTARDVLETPVDEIIRALPGFRRLLLMPWMRAHFLGSDSFDGGLGRWRRRTVKALAYFGLTDRMSDGLRYLAGRAIGG